MLRKASIAGSSVASAEGDKLLVDKMLEVEYELTRDDLFAFQMRASTSTPVARRMLKRINVLYAVTIVVVALLMRPWASLFALSAFGVFCLVFVGGGLLSYRYLSRRLIDEYVRDNAPDKGVLGWHRIRLDDTGVTESTAVGESRVSWNGIHRVERDTSALYIYTGPNQAHMIPVRAFATPGDAEAFFAFAKSRVDRPS